ncbi:MAG: flagellar basal body-associated FliL family protein [Aestuariivirga sp.]|uniref:flagellar basal body-associated FliL family protein n=1 Tax=Aestuariivirga sp. TaxID=2650926 RepID=UPI0038D12B46
MADDASGKNKTLLTTLVVILLLTLMGAGVGFAVGVLLKPPANSGQAMAPSDSTPAQEAASGKQSDTATETAAADAHGSGATHETKAEGDGEPPEDEDQPAPKDVTVVPFSPVLTTLGSPREKWIRLEGAILVKAESQVPVEQLAERAGEQILAYLRTVNLAHIEGPSGFLSLRHDLNETLKALSSGEVQGVLIHGLVVE